MKIKTLWSAIACVLLATSVYAQQTSNACGPILNIGLQDTYNFFRSNSFSSTVTKAACEEVKKQKTISGSASVDLGVVTEIGASMGLPLPSGKADANYLDSLESKVCGAEGSIASSHELSVATMMLNSSAPAIVKEYNSCLAITKENDRKPNNGLFATVENYDATRNFSLKVELYLVNVQARGPQNPHLSPSTNVVCEGGDKRQQDAKWSSVLDRGRMRNGAVANFLCKVTDNKAASIVIDTKDAGSMRDPVFLPTKPPFIPPPPASGCNLRVSGDRPFESHSESVISSACTLGTKSVVTATFEGRLVPAVGQWNSKATFQLCLSRNLSEENCSNVSRPIEVPWGSSSAPVRIEHAAIVDPGVLRIRLANGYCETNFPQDTWRPCRYSKFEGAKISVSVVPVSNGNVPKLPELAKPAAK